MNQAIDLIDEAGITYRQLDHWIRQGYIEADHIGGSGNLRTFNPFEWRVTVLMAGLVGIGFTPGRAAEIARTMAAGRSVVVIGRYVLCEVTTTEGG